MTSSLHCFWRVKVHVWLTKCVRKSWSFKKCWKYKLEMYLIWWMQGGTAVCKQYIKGRCSRFSKVNFTRNRASCVLCGIHVLFFFSSCRAVLCFLHHWFRLHPPPEVRQSIWPKSSVVWPLTSPTTISWLPASERHQFTNSMLLRLRYCRWFVLDSLWWWKSLYCMYHLCCVCPAAVGGQRAVPVLVSNPSGHLSVVVLPQSWPAAGNIRTWWSYQPRSQDKGQRSYLNYL